MIVPKESGSWPVVILLAKSQHPHPSVGISCTKSRVSGSAGQFASSIKYAEVREDG
jgi:hypothetical protein